MRSVGRFGEHRRDRLADVAHGASRQRPARAFHHAGQHPSRAHRPNAVPLEVLAGRYENIAGAAGFDAQNTRVRVRRAHQRAVEHARKDEVIDEIAAAGEQACVFDAADRRADHPISSRRSSSRS